MKNAARIANTAMWVMIGAIVLTFFSSASWIKIVWVVAAVACLVCVLIVAFNKRKNKRGY
jgi:hypothetical protein